MGTESNKLVKPCQVSVIDRDFFNLFNECLLPKLIRPS